MENVQAIATILRHRFTFSIFDVNDSQNYSKISVSKEMVEAAIARYEFFKNSIENDKFTKANFTEAIENKNQVFIAQCCASLENLRLHVVDKGWHNNDSYSHKVIDTETLWGYSTSQFSRFDKKKLFCALYNPDSFPDKRIQRSKRWDQTELCVHEIFEVISDLRMYYKEKGFDDRIKRNISLKGNHVVEDEVEQLIKSKKKVYALVVDIHVPTQTYYRTNTSDRQTMESATLCANTWYPALQHVITSLSNLRCAYCSLETDGLRGFNLHTLLLLNGNKKIDENKVLREINQRIEESRIWSIVDDLNFSVINWNAVVRQLSGKNPVGYLNKFNIQDFRDWVLSYLFHADLFLELSEALNSYNSDLNAERHGKVQKLEGLKFLELSENNPTLLSRQTNSIRSNKKELQVVDFLNRKERRRIWNKNLLDKNRLVYYRAFKAYVENFSLLPEVFDNQPSPTVTKFALKQAVLNIEFFMLLLEQRNWNRLRALAQRDPSPKILKSNSDECHRQFIDILETLVDHADHIRNFCRKNQSALRLSQLKIFNNIVIKTFHHLRIKDFLENPLDSHSTKEIDNWLEKIREAQIATQREDKRDIELGKCYKQINEKYPYLRRLFNKPSLTVRFHVYFNSAEISEHVQLAPQVLTDFIKFLRLKIKKLILKGYIGHWLETDTLTADVVLFFDLYSIADQIDFYKVVETVWYEFHKVYTRKGKDSDSLNQVQFKIINLFDANNSTRVLTQLLLENDKKLKQQFIDSVFNFYCFCNLFYGSCRSGQNTNPVSLLRKRFIKGTEALVAGTKKKPKDENTSSGQTQGSEDKVKDCTDFIGRV